MIIGIGCDIIEIARIEAAAQKDSFVKRVFTEAEALYCLSRGKNAAASFAARFAAKEAALKALGTGLRDGRLREIEIRNNALGKPELCLSGAFAELASGLGVKRTHLSLSHGRSEAIAYVVMED